MLRHRPIAAVCHIGSRNDDRGAERLCPPIAGDNGECVMNVQANQSANKVTGTNERFAAAVALLGESVPESFARALLGGAAPEDVAAFPPEALACLAREAYAHLRQRPPGRHDVKVFNPDWPGASAITVIEAVNDDMAFLFDSVAGELSDRGLELKLVSHPILAVERDAAGTLTALDANLHEAEGRQMPHESLIHLHVQRIDAEAARADLQAALDQTLDDVRAANRDFVAMRNAVHEVSKGYRREVRPYPEEEREEAADFVEWLVLDNFTFIGVRTYRFTADGGLEADAQSGLGILKDPQVRELSLGDEAVGDSPESRKFLSDEVPLVITKSSLRSRVHRRTYLDYVGVEAA